jgi:hypothetical protein
MTYSCQVDILTLASSTLIPQDPELARLLDGGQQQATDQPSPNKEVGLPVRHIVLATATSHLVPNILNRTARVSQLFRFLQDAVRPTHQVTMP